MIKFSKHAKMLQKKVQAGKFYTIKEALSLLKEVSSVKFIESVDTAINLGIDPRKSDQVIRGSVMLPNGIGKNVRIAVFAQGPDIEAARIAGADSIGMDDLAEEIKIGKVNFDVVIASHNAIKIVSQLGQILGPRGLMPNLKMGTLTSNITQAVKDARTGQVRYRTDKGGILHCSIGKINFETAALQQNLEALLSNLKKSKPHSLKGIYLKKITISTTMGPGILLDQASLKI